MENFLVASLAALALASAANAQDVRIGFSDLDLATPEGARAFDARVEREARIACTGTGSRLPDSLCIRNFRAEVFRLLPERPRLDHARATAETIAAPTAHR